jgi:phosphoribosylamine-glycine ligase
MERYGTRRGSIWSALSDGLLGVRSPGEGIFTTGGAVLAVVAHDSDLATARARVYHNLERIHLAGSAFLPSVGEREL